MLFSTCTLQLKADRPCLWDHLSQIWGTICSNRCRYAAVNTLVNVLWPNIYIMTIFTLAECNCIKIVEFTPQCSLPIKGVPIFISALAILALFEPTCAYCTVGSYASLSVCPSVRPSLDNNNRVIESGTWKHPGRGPAVYSKQRWLTFPKTTRCCVAVTCRAHCQYQVTFFSISAYRLSANIFSVDISDIEYRHLETYQQNIYMKSSPIWKYRQYRHIGNHQYLHIAISAKMSYRHALTSSVTYFRQSDLKYTKN